MSQRFSKYLVMAVLAISTVVMVSISFDAEARRFGGGRSFGRQSPNVMQQRQAVTPPQAVPRAATPAAGAATARSANQAAAPARSGMSRFMAPLAGIAAGLGIAALLSHLGLAGPFFEMLFMAGLLALVVFGGLFIVRRLRGSLAPAGHGARAQHHNQHRRSNPTSIVTARTAEPMARSSQPEAAIATPASASAAPADPGWFIPDDFDTPAFLNNAKAQFIAIQGYWDRGDVEELEQYLTNDLLIELKPQILQRQNEGQATEVVLLNAELLGIETVAGGYLASVRYSGMLRETAGAEASRFEEAWNLYKADNAGWLVAGIQQIPSQQTH